MHHVKSFFHETQCLSMFQNKYARDFLSCNRLTIRGVACEASEDDEDVVHVQLLHDLVRLVLRGRHRLKQVHSIAKYPN